MKIPQNRMLTIPERVSASDRRNDTHGQIITTEASSLFRLLGLSIAFFFNIQEARNATTSPIANEPIKMTIKKTPALANVAMLDP
jgi:hypothetical protein